MALHSREHGVVDHEPVEFVDDAAMQFAGVFPSEDVAPQSFSESAQDRCQSAGACRAVPLLLEVVYLRPSEQAGCAKPAQNCVEIGEQFERFAILHGASIQEIQNQVVAEEEEPVAI